ncbi:MAG TPA: GNAT family N-acetyltransferase [Thermomicrobiales bacterium]|nr:GNAT family N-acetyltransferase [Thermomicrobiales bacterium]
MSAARYGIEPLADRHDRASFSCGVEPLDRYLRQQAGQDLRRNLAAVFVLAEVATDRIAGYYTLSPFTIEPTSLPAALTRRLPDYAALPAVLLGRLAVDERERGQGLGEALLRDALARSYRQRRQIAAMAVVVDAKDDAARAFYEHYGFARFADIPYRLYLPMGTIGDLIS